MIPGMPLNNRPFLVHTISSWAPDGFLGRGYDLFLEMGSPTYPVNVMVIVEAGVTISTYQSGLGLGGPPLSGDPILWGAGYWPAFAIRGELTPGDGTGFTTGSFVLLVNRGRINAVGGIGGLGRDGFVGGGTNFRFWGGGGGGGGGLTQAGPGLTVVGGPGQIGAPPPSFPSSRGASGTELAGGAGGIQAGSTGFTPLNRDPTVGRPGGDAIAVHSRVTFAVDNTDGEIWGGGGGGGGAEMVFGELSAVGGAGGAPGVAGSISVSGSGGLAGGAAGFAIRGEGTIVVHATGDIRGSVGP